MKRKKIEIVALFFHSSSAEVYVESVRAFSNDVIVCFFNQKKIWIEHTSINSKQFSFSFIDFKTAILNYLLSPIILLFKCMTIFFVLCYLCMKYRVETVIVESVYGALLGGLVKKMHLTGKGVYLAGDWLVAAKGQGLLSYLANQFIFPLVDYCACKLNDTTLNLTETIGVEREKYWKRKITPQEKTITLPLRMRSPIRTSYDNCKTIFFLGYMRNDSGLDIAIKSLPELRKYEDFKLLVVGPYSWSYKYFYNVAKAFNIEQFVSFAGFIKREELATITKDCFCGINLITDPRSYSKYTLTAKSVDYLQYLLPVIVSPYIGVYINIISQYDLGLIIQPTQEEFVPSVLQIYNQNKYYRENVIKHMLSNNTQTINWKELL